MIIIVIYLHIGLGCAICKIPHIQ